MGRPHSPSALSAMSNRLRSAPLAACQVLASIKMVTTLQAPFRFANEHKRLYRSSTCTPMQVRQFAEKYFGSWRDARAAAPAVPAAADQPTAAPPSTDRQAGPICCHTPYWPSRVMRIPAVHAPASAHFGLCSWKPVHRFGVLAAGSLSSPAWRAQQFCTHFTGRASAARMHCPWTSSGTPDCVFCWFRFQSVCTVQWLVIWACTPAGCTVTRQQCI
jgi:hypothetical protein